MSMIKGLRVGNTINVSQDIRFTGQAQSRYPSPWSKSWFVDGVNGVDTNSGTSPTDAVKTIQAAVTLAGRGDTIYIRPQTYTLGTGFARYTEDVTVTLLKNDLSIIGVTNALNPEFGVRWKHVATHLTVDAPGLHLENIGFFGEGATHIIDLTQDLNVSKAGSNGFSAYNCAFKGSDVLINAGDGARIQNCYFHAMYDGSVVGGIKAVGSAAPIRRLQIRDCSFMAGNGTTAATAYIEIAGVASEVVIDGCRFELIPTSAKYILATASTGILSNCFFADADIHRTNDLTLDNIVMVGCWDGSGALIA